MGVKILNFKFLFLFFIFLFFYNGMQDKKTITGNAIIIDGDTIHINNDKIRLHGIDAPEINQTCIYNQKEWDCGKKSYEFLKNLTFKKTVSCNIMNKDKYKRYIGICYVNKKNINSYIVEKGWAIAYRYYSKDYIEKEFIAKKNKSGIWKGEFEAPYLFRKKNN